MTTTPNRRRFIAIIPFAGAALLTACSKEVDTAPRSTVEPAPSPAPMPPAAVESRPAMPQTPEPAPASTAGMPMVDENEPQAKALGYVNVATRADTAKYKSYVAGSQCSNCALYTGKPGDAAGGCPLFAGQQVAAKAWCASWVKKA